MEPEGSLPHSQELPTRPNPVHTPLILSLQDASQYYPFTKGVPVTTAWRDLGLRMEGRPPAVKHLNGPRTWKDCLDKRPKQV
jgi:hypothetical protein